MVGLLILSLQNRLGKRADEVMADGFVVHPWAAARL